MAKTRFFVYFSLYVAMTWDTWNGVTSCTEGLDPVGWIVPYEDQIIKVGGSFTMSCLLSTTQTAVPSATSRDLRFLFNDKPVSDSQVRIVNDTTIEYYEQNATLTLNDSFDRVSCKLYNYHLCTKYVIVGYEPLPVTNFSCISNNWESLTCTWDEPSNPITTSYSLCYVPSIRTGAACRPCPSNYSSQGSCTWPTADYAKFPKLSFTMKMSNALANETQTFLSVNHYAIMLPNQMENLEVSNVTKNECHVSWLIPANLENFPGGLDFKLSYRPTANWSTANETVLEGSDLEIVNETTEPLERIAILTGLPFPNVPYEVKVYAKSNQSENLWSKPASTTLRTLPDIPCKEPAITSGSFRLNAHQLFVYWDPIPPQCENGDDFHYQDLNTAASFAQFNDTSLSEDYTVSIRSVNSVGAAARKASILIPSQSNILSKPLEVIAVHYADDRLLEVTWSHNKTETIHPSYTVFWCSQGTSDDHCNGKLQWVEVSENTTAYNMTVTGDFTNNHLVFVTANRGQYSSGMEKACPKEYDGTIDTVEVPTISDVTSTGWKMTWKPIACGQRKGFIDKYRIYISAEDLSNERNFTVDNTVYSYVIDDANPMKNYTIQMSVLSRHGEGKRSDPLSVFTTSEEWYTWPAVGVTLAVVVLCISAALFGYRHFTILRKTKGMRAHLPWHSQSMVSSQMTEKQGGSYLAPPHKPAVVPYDRFSSVLPTMSPLTSTSSLSDRSSLGSESSDTITSNNELDTPWTPVMDQLAPVFDSVEQESNQLEQKEKNVTSANPSPDAGFILQPYVMLGDSQMTKPQPGYVTLGQQQEKPVEHTEPASAIATGYVTVGRNGHSETRFLPNNESIKQRQEEDQFGQDKNDVTALRFKANPGTLLQPYVMLEDSQMTKPQPGYVTLGQQQEKPVEHTEPASAIATGYVTVGRNGHSETGFVPNKESIKQIVPGYVQLGHLEHNSELKNNTCNVLKVNVDDSKFTMAS